MRKSGNTVRATTSRLSLTTYITQLGCLRAVKTTKHSSSRSRSKSSSTTSGGELRRCSGLFSGCTCGSTACQSVSRSSLVAMNNCTISCWASLSSRPWFFSLSNAYSLGIKASPIFRDGPSSTLLNSSYLLASRRSSGIMLRMMRRRHPPFQSSKCFSCSWLSWNCSFSSGCSRSTDSSSRWSCTASEIWPLSWWPISLWSLSSRFVSPCWAQRLMAKWWTRELRGTSKENSNSWSCRYSVPQLVSYPCPNTRQSRHSQTPPWKRWTYTWFGPHGSSNLSSCSLSWWTSWSPSFPRRTARYRPRERSSTTGTRQSSTRKPSSWCRRLGNSPCSELWSSLPTANKTPWTMTK